MLDRVERFNFKRYARKRAKQYGIRLAGVDIAPIKPLANCITREFKDGSVDHIINISERVWYNGSVSNSQIKQIILHELAHALENDIFGINRTNTHGRNFQCACSILKCVFNQEVIKKEKVINAFESRYGFKPQIM